MILVYSVRHNSGEYPYVTDPLFEATADEKCTNAHCCAVQRRLQCQCKDSEALYMWYRARYLHLAARFEQLEDTLRKAGVASDGYIQNGGVDSFGNTLAGLYDVADGATLTEVPEVTQRPTKRSRI